MKKLKNQILMVLSFLVVGMGTTFAQDFNGTATYQSARKARSIKFSGEGITPEMQKQLDEMMKKRDQKEFELKFNLTESIWKEAESLEGGAPSGSAGGIQVMSFSSGGANGTTYRNTADNLSLKQSDLFGKPFLVRDELENRAWELTNETKKIGNYTAQKAVYSRTVQRQMITFNNDVEGEPEMKTDTMTVEAWYTPEIPVSHGPQDYWGLPGLILEVNDGTTTYLCTKVVLNPEGGVTIKKPKKGKKVTQEEYQELVKEKAKEMSEKYSGGGATFRIGGGQQ